MPASSKGQVNVRPFRISQEPVVVTEVEGVIHADALEEGECVLFFRGTAGAPTFTIVAKDTDGVVYDGSITLSEVEPAEE